jgi:hypothetical protein
VAIIKQPEENSIMEDRKKIESLGFIVKKEKLASIVSEIRYTELILEDLDPYPGFYDHHILQSNPDGHKPHSIFFILKNFDVRHEDQFIRMTMRIKHDHSLKFDAVPGSLVLFNKDVPCIRVFMDDESRIKELIEYYKKGGISFEASTGVKHYQSLIKLRKYFDMDRMAKGIYKDADQPDIYYIEVPEFISWDVFEQATISIRNNWDHKIYDAAQAAIYQKTGVIDMVRIYDKKSTLDGLQYLQEQYHQESNRY